MIHTGSFLKTLERFLVVDLEATCWSRGDIRPSDAKEEIIEIGGCLYVAGDYQISTIKSDLQRGYIEKCWRMFVQPRRYSQLSAFCKALTQISQDVIDKAPKLYDVWHSWNDLDLQNMKPFIFTSWGDFDYDLLKKDLQSVGVRDTVFPIHLNLKNYFGDMTGWRRLGLGEAVKKCGLEFQGQQHSGVDDAFNTARVLDWLVQQEDR